MTTTRLLSIIAIVLIGIFTIMIIEYDGKNLGDKIKDTANEAVEEIEDELDDATTQ